MKRKYKPRRITPTAWQPIPGRPHTYGRGSVIGVPLLDLASETGLRRVPIAGYRHGWVDAITAATAALRALPGVTP